MKRYILWIKLAVAVVILYLLARTDLVDLAHLPSLKDHPGTLALAALCLFAGIAISALRCAILLRASGFDIRTITVFRLQLIGALFSNVLPGATGGDAVRILYLCRILPTHR